jgi:hypothetical protein
MASCANCELSRSGIDRSTDEQIVGKIAAIVNRVLVAAVARSECAPILGPWVELGCCRSPESTLSHRQNIWGDNSQFLGALMHQAAKTR